MSNIVIHNLSPVAHASAEGKQKEVLDLANAPGMLSTYLHGYDLFRKESSFTPVEQEMVF
jgi:hypothetical protein